VRLACGCGEYFNSTVFTLFVLYKALCSCFSSFGSHDHIMKIFYNIKVCTAIVEAYNQILCITSCLFVLGLLQPGISVSKRQTAGPKKFFGSRRGAENVPRFFWPKGKPLPLSTVAETIDKADAHFQKLSSPLSYSIFAQVGLTAIHIVFAFCSGSLSNYNVHVHFCSYSKQLE